jgi:hypothetical protein
MYISVKPYVHEAGLDTNQAIAQAADYIWPHTHPRMEPVQKVGHAPLSAVPAPCGSQQERYGERTASG